HHQLCAICLGGWNCCTLAAWLLFQRFGRRWFRVHFWNFGDGRCYSDFCSQPCVTAHIAHKRVGERHLQKAVESRAHHSDIGHFRIGPCGHIKRYWLGCAAAIGHRYHWRIDQYAALCSFAYSTVVLVDSEKPENVST